MFNDNSSHGLDCFPPLFRKYDSIPALLEIVQPDQYQRLVRLSLSFRPATHAELQQYMSQCILELKVLLDKLLASDNLLTPFRQSQKRINRLGSVWMSLNYSMTR